jgi:hypothetical protein
MRSHLHRLWKTILFPVSIAVSQPRSLTKINVASSIILCISLKVARMEKGCPISSTEIPELAFRVTAGWIRGVMTAG